jgi:hypothetical protein
MTSAMPSVTIMRSMCGRLAPSPAYVIDFAARKVFFSASAFPMSGFLAPARLPMPMPDRPSGVRVATLPAFARLSIASVVMIATSNGSPALTFSMSDVEVPDWAVTL